ncbi:MFS transporter, partial [Heyndrickxia coagulans]|nr:MFS transporter [Heyndrickxia coagulans]
SKLTELKNGVLIIKKEPKVGVAGIVRIINQASQYAFPLFLPLYLEDKGIGTTVWLNIWGTIFFFRALAKMLYPLKL